MKLKRYTNILGLKAEILLGATIADGVYRDTMGQGVTITSGVDGKHSYASSHYLGYAVDLRTRYDDRSEQWSKGVKNHLVQELKSRLGADFDVVMHSTHIHLEYQPKR